MIELVKRNEKYRVIKSGQSRPYADSERIVEVYLEKGLTKNEAYDQIASMNIGLPLKDIIPDWYEPKVSYLRETDAGVWEFKTVSAYTG